VTPASAGRALAATAPSTLAGTVESVQATLRLAASNGVSRARLALHPAELGGVEVHLRSSAAGLVASVRADSPEAAKLLQQAAGQLRDSLEQQGLTLLQLDIGSTGERQVGAGANRDQRSSGTPGEQLATPDEDEPEVTASVRLPNGVLVDVLA
jgi:flagellar hook-length control protein FliK